MTIVELGQNYTLFIDRDMRRIEVKRNGVTTFFPLNNIPHRLYQAIANLADEPTEETDVSLSIAKSSVHKSDVVTYLQGSPFRLNIAPKFIRLTLNDHELERQVDNLEGELLSLQGKNFQDIIEDAKSIYRKLHVDESKMDPLRLGAMELYGLSTYQNILHDPRAALGFNWYDCRKKEYTGYQLNCIVELHPPGSLFYRYMRVMRALFARKWLDVGSDEYLCAYCFWVSEVKDKTLQHKSGFDSPTTDD